MGIKRMSCVIWTLLYLKRKKVSIPDECEGYTLDSNNSIIQNEELLIKEKIWFKVFNSFMQETTEIKDNNVICHANGAGITKKGLMMTIDKFNKIVLREIPKESKFYKVINV